MKNHLNKKTIYSFNLLVAFYTLNNVSLANGIDVQVAYRNAFSSLLVNCVVAALVFWLLSFDLIGKVKNTPLKLARWIAAIFSAMNIISSINYNSTQDEYIYKVFISTVGFYIIGFISGYLWGIFRKTTDNKLNEHKEEDLSAYAEAISEINSNNRNDGLWAKCYAEANGDKFKAEAAYIKVRAQELTSSKQKQTEKLQEVKTEEFNADSSVYLFKNKMYQEKTYGKRKYLLLDNQNAAIIFDGVVHIYICEKDFFNAIDVGDLQNGCKLVFRKTFKDTTRAEI